MECKGWENNLKAYMSRGETTPEYDAHIEKCSFCKTAIEKEFDRICEVFKEMRKFAKGEIKWEDTEAYKSMMAAPRLVTFSPEEVSAVYDLIDALSGGNASNGFAWDGTDDINDPTTSALVKIFKSVKRRVPENLE